MATGQIQRHDRIRITHGYESPSLTSSVKQRAGRFGKPMGWLRRKSCLKSRPQQTCLTNPVRPAAMWTL
jgi:hypothetical protein